MLHESSAGLKFGRLPVFGDLDRMFVEKMPWNKELHPWFWDNDNQKLWGSVSAELKLISNHFLRFVQIPKDQVEDVVFKGSLATYNYTPTSDIDLQIILKYDWESNPLRDSNDKHGLQLRNKWETARAQFNKEMNYTMAKEKFPVELFIQTPKSNRATGASARWSILHNDWLPGYKPNPNTPGTPPKEIDRYFKNYYARVKQTYLDKLKLARFEAAITARKELGSISGNERELALHGIEGKAAQHDADISSPENLAFKALKRTKLIAYIESEIEKGKQKGLMSLKQNIDLRSKTKRA